MLLRHHDAAVQQLRGGGMLRRTTPYYLPPLNAFLHFLRPEARVHRGLPRGRGEPVSISKMQSSKTILA